MAKKNKSTAATALAVNVFEASNRDDGDVSPLASQEYFSDPDVAPQKATQKDEVNEYAEYAKPLDPAEFHKPDNFLEDGEVPGSDDIRVGSYKLDGVLFIFADSRDIYKVNSYTTKSAIYAYRFKINMPNAGIEVYGSSYIVGLDEEPQSLYKDTNSKSKVYRVIYRVTNGI